MSALDGIETDLFDLIFRSFNLIPLDLIIRSYFIRSYLFGLIRPFKFNIFNLKQTSLDVL
jgi:hypothetical protein